MLLAMDDMFTTGMLKDMRKYYNNKANQGVHYSIEQTTKAGWILPSQRVGETVVFECPDKSANCYHQHPCHRQQWLRNEAVKEQSNIQRISNEEKVEEPQNVVSV